MARYTGASCRKCRREGQKLFLKGERCYTDKCAVQRRNTAPGQHGKNKSKLSEYGIQLREKQKTKVFYGILEKQFRKYFEEADRRTGITGENLLQLLELRFDNVAYRLGIGSSRKESRQIVGSALLLVNGKKVNIPSYSLKVGDIITVRENKKEIIAKYFEKMTKTVPSWLEVDTKNMIGKVVKLPSRDEIDLNVQESLIVELYSK